MDHSIRAEGFGVRLRPVRMEDAAFLVWLRNLEHAKGRVGDSATDVAQQQDWLRAYFARAGDYYFVIETAGSIPVGAYGIYDVRGDRGESGRWIVGPDVPAAIPSAILGLDLAFGELRLLELRAKTVATNRTVLSLNRKFGFRQVGVETKAQVIGGQPVDLIHFVLTSENWQKARVKLVPLASLAQRQIREWEEAQKREEERAKENLGIRGKQ